jgi:hypothetical protein
MCKTTEIDNDIESQERQELRKDIEELSREFHEELQMLDIGLTKMNEQKIINLCEIKEFRHDDEQHTIPLGQVVILEEWDGDEWRFGHIEKNKHFAERFDDPDFQGTTFRERHYIPGGRGDYEEGDLFQEIVLGIKGKLKMIVVGHHRDCDGTPLYVLSFKPIGFPIGKYAHYDEENKKTICPHPDRSDFSMSMKYSMWVGFTVNGISESCLTICKDEFVPLKYEDVFEYEESMRG